MDEADAEAATFFKLALWDLPVSAGEARALLTSGLALGVGGSLRERQQMVLNLYPNSLLQYEHAE